MFIILKMFQILYQQTLESILNSTHYWNIISKGHTSITNQSYCLQVSMKTGTLHCISDLVWH